MSRKKRDFKRVVLPDPKYGSTIITKLINVLTIDGKKSVAEKAFYTSLDIIGKKLNAEHPLEIFVSALTNIRPVIEVRSRRVGGANYQVPTEVRGERAQSLAIRWMVSAASMRSEKNISERLAGEIMDAKNNRGGAVKKKEDTHKMADANKAFAHFKW